MVTVDTISVKIEDQILLKSLSCTLIPKHITSFIGRSGTGKTTLLKSMCGIIQPSNGKIIIDGKDLNVLAYQQKAKTIGYVFQDFNLFPHLTALENCIDPLVAYGKTINESREEAIKILNQLGMADFINHYPAQLSGGQKQRIAIARALCLHPNILLLDEPTASLDPENTDILVNILKKLAKDGLTVGLCSQDMNFIKKIFDRIYYLESSTIIEFCDNINKLDEFPLIKSFIN